MGNPIAERFLKAAVGAARLGNSPRLQSVRAMAQACGVSLVTMWKAVHELSARGIVNVKHGSGIYLADSATLPLQRAPYQTGCLWKRTAAGISADILTGAFRADSVLPSQKELLQRYGVHPGTLRRSLASLSHDGIVKRERTRYRIMRPLVHHAGQSTLVLILPEKLISLMQWSYYANAVQSFMSMLERECDRRSILLVRRTFAQALHDVKLLRDSLGCVYWIGGNEEEATGFFQALPLVDKPHSIVNYWYRFTLPSQCVNAANCTIMSVDEHNAMVLLGRYALQKGHQRVAYFRFSEDPFWNEVRLAGIREAYASARMDPESITVFDCRLSTNGRSPGKKPEAAYDTLLDMVGQSIKNEAVREMLTMRLFEARSYGEISHRTARGFEAAARIPEIKAWICESDSLAIHGALPFLQNRGVPLAHPSVMAFGDSPEASCSGLTTVVQRMDWCVEQVMRNTFDLRLQKKYLRIIPIPNTVIFREA